jgi:CheY-like chemotaxis protein
MENQRTPAPSSNRAERSRSAPPDGQRQQKILVVDDELDVLRSTQMLLERMGYVCMLLPDPERLVEVIEHDRPDLVLQDLVMPGLDLPAVMDRLHHSTVASKIPIVFFSASTELAERAAEFDAAGFLNKPFVEQQLRSVLERLLGPVPRQAAQERPTPPNAAEATGVGKPVREQHREAVRTYFHAYRNTLTALNNYAQFLLNSQTIQNGEREASEEISRLLLELEERSDALRSFLLGEEQA